MPAPPQPGQTINGFTFLGGDYRDKTRYKPETGDKYLDSFTVLSPEQKNLIKGMAAYDLPPGSQRGGLGSPEVQQLLGLARGYDPTFDAKQYKVRQDMLHEVNQGDTGKQLKNLTNVSLHARDLLDAYDQMNLSGNSATNYVENFAARNFPFTPNMHARQSQIGRTLNAVNFLAPEAARMGMGAAPNEADIKDIKDQYNENTPPDLAGGGIGDMGDKIAQRLLGIQDQWKRAFGNTPPKQPFINKDAAIALHDILTRFKVKGSDQLDWNVLTSGGFSPKQAQDLRGGGATPKPPAGVTPAEWQHMTPDERKLFAPHP